MYSIIPHSGTFQLKLGQKYLNEDPHLRTFQMQLAKHLYIQDILNVRRGKKTCILCSVPFLPRSYNFLNKSTK
jgi:hypothetical protein